MRDPARGAKNVGKIERTGRNGKGMCRRHHHSTLLNCLRCIITPKRRNRTEQEMRRKRRNGDTPCFGCTGRESGNSTYVRYVHTESQGSTCDAIDTRMVVEWSNESPSKDPFPTSPEDSRPILATRRHKALHCVGFKVQSLQLRRAPHLHASPTFPFLSFKPELLFSPFGEFFWTSLDRGG